MVSTGNYDGAIHAMGNGRLLVYGKGANIVHVFGPPYSTPSLFSGEWKFADGNSPEFCSQREKGTSIWHHRFERKGSGVGTVQQFVSPDVPAYFNKVVLDEEELTLICPLPEGYRCIKESAQLYGCEGKFNRLLFIAPDTDKIFIYPSGEKAYLSMTCWGEGFGSIEVKGDCVLLKFVKGDGYFSLAGGSSYPDVVFNAEKAHQLTYEQHMLKVYAEGKQVMSRLKLPVSERPLESGILDKVHALCENIAFLIKAQQSEDGGIVAGYLFPLAYIRDQFGTCRGLLALGLFEEARRNLEFRFAKWRQFGNLRNAESMGHHRVRHVHENDDVEGTAYTILQVFDYAKATGDDAVVEKMFPMMDWCWRTQIAHLRNDMLPFNGDETYVAGSFLPRYSLNDGSMEATFLFIESGRKLSPLARRRGWWHAEEARQFEIILSQAERQFRDNFWRIDHFVANNSARGKLPGMPAFRHGVCEGCLSIEWTRRNKYGRYACPQCWSEVELFRKESQEMEVSSAGLLPLFIHSEMLSDEEKTLGVLRAADIFQKKGYLPTVETQNRFVGYDAGLLLYGLAESKHPIAEQVFKHVIGIVDTAGAWVEYYLEGTPQGCRCRPWESGMNIAAVIHYLSLLK